MNDPAPSPDILAALAALRAELDAVKAQLSDLQEVVTIRERDGHRTVSIRCSSLVIHQFRAPNFIAINLGAKEDGGFLSLQYPDKERPTAVSIAIGQNGQPAIRVQGHDSKARVLLTSQNDHGLISVLAPGYIPGANIRAIPGGGSFCVLQPDGQARAILLHSDGTGSRAGRPATELLFSAPGATTQLAIRADAEGSTITAGYPEEANRFTLVSREDSTTLLIRSPGDSSCIAATAGHPMARISTWRGPDPSTGAEAGLCSDADGSGLSLSRHGGTHAFDFHVSSDSASMAMLAPDGSQIANLSHNDAHLTCFSLRSTSSHDTIEAIAGPESATFAVVSPADPDAQILTMAREDRLTLNLAKDNRPLVVLGHTPHGGSVIAMGSGENPGQACLAGSTVTGGLALATSDGTQLLTLGANDYGGCLAINNDLGFQRILLATCEESSSLILNHTGQIGVSATATPVGSRSLTSLHRV